MTTPLAPIIVMSFNRPDYLAQVLTSLMAQVGADIERRPVYLFQDGQRNPFSSRGHGPPELIGQSVETFRTMLPGGVVMESPDNLGVALNFDRAERFAFEELDARAAIFLEDDMVLSQHYVATLDHMIETYANDQRVGYLGAYGDYQLSLEEQRRDPTRLLALHHNWAFALYRRQWQAMRPRVEEYMALVRGVDYRARDHEAIWALYAAWGFGRQSSSQDAAKTMACLLTPSIKIKTRPCLGRYIGERGLHMSPATYEKRGFGKTEMYPDPLTEFEALTDDVYHRIYGEIRRWAGKPVPSP